MAMIRSTPSNRHLRHNLMHWPPLRAVKPGGHFYGSQAFLVSSATGRFTDAHWDEVAGMGG